MHMCHIIQIVTTTQSQEHTHTQVLFEQRAMNDDNNIANILQ